MTLSPSLASLDHVLLPTLFCGSSGFPHVISQNSVLFSTLFSCHTLSLGSLIYTCNLMSKLNTEDFAQRFTLHIMQVSPVNMSRPELPTFPKLALCELLITADGTTSILWLNPETKVYRLLHSLLSPPATYQIPFICLLTSFSLHVHHLLIDSLLFTANATAIVWRLLTFPIDCLSDFNSVSTFGSFPHFYPIHLDLVNRN